MNRIALFALFLTVPAVRAHADPGPTDAQAIMRLVVANQARINRGGPFDMACVRAETWHTALDGERERHGSGQYRWTRPATMRAGAWTDGTPLDQDEARLLSAVADAIVRGEPAARSIERIDPAWLGTLAFCGSGRSRPSLLFSAPAIRGDAAFVDVGMSCGGLCGRGLLYALRRRESGWEIVSVIGTWIS